MAAGTRGIGLFGGLQRAGLERQRGEAQAWLSPVLFTFLLLKVSGVNLQQQDLRSRGPAYVDCARRTSAFMPWSPKAIASG